MKQITVYTKKKPDNYNDGIGITISYTENEKYIVNEIYSILKDYYSGREDIKIIDDRIIKV
jgi:hypothetical protein